MAVELAYFTLDVPDTERGARFYGDLFDWRFDDAPAGHTKAYRHVNNTRLPGGLVNGDAVMPLRPYFRVDDIHVAVDRVRALGGRSDEPSQSESGWSCLAHDDQDVPFGLWQPAPSSEST